MELKAQFSNIHKVIIHHLEQAYTEIVAAIAWFTDRDSPCGIDFASRPNLGAVYRAGRARQHCKIFAKN